MPQKSRIIPALILGLLAAVISALGSERASYWGDEAASILSANRSLESLWPVLGNVDAVHGFYYVFLHYWTNLFGAGEFATRLPSAIAVGAAATGIFLLVSRLSGPRLALISTLIFAILPRVTTIGSEARGYAIATAGVVWLVYGLIRLLDTYPRRKALWWVWALGLALTATMFMYALLILPVIGLWLLIERRGPERFWYVIRFGIVGVILSLPIIVIGFSERDQIGFLANRPPGVRGVMVTQWFGDTPMAVLAWALIVAAGIALVIAIRAGADTRLAVLAMTWMALPPVMLGLISIISPSYSQRYLSICTPAVAIVLALGIEAITRWVKPVAVGRGVGLVLILALIVTALPSYQAQRTVNGKDGSDFRQLAEHIGARATPGDAMVFNTDIRPSRKPRLAARLYPEHFVGVLDPGLITAYDQTDGLWDIVEPAESTRIPENVETVWYVISGPNKAERQVPDLHSLEDQGFEVVDDVTFARSRVFELNRVSR